MPVYHIYMFQDVYSHILNYMVRPPESLRRYIKRNAVCFVRVVEADYTVVFFAAGGRNTPGWNWVWKAYRSLSRKYRKNLKKLVGVLEPRRLNASP